jgi:surface protein
LLLLQLYWVAQSCIEDLPCLSREKLNPNFRELAMYNHLPFSRATVVLLMLLSFSHSVLSANSKEPLTDTSISEALALWLENPEEAENVFGPIELWDTSEVTNLDNLFQNQAHFNRDISQWDVSKVTSMKKTFAACTKFNSPLNDW